MSQLNLFEFFHLFHLLLYPSCPCASEPDVLPLHPFALPPLCFSCSCASAPSCSVLAPFCPSTFVSLMLLCPFTLMSCSCACLVPLHRHVLSLHPFPPSTLVPLMPFASPPSCPALAPFCPSTLVPFHPPAILHLCWTPRSRPSKATVYQSHFPPLMHIIRETPQKQLVTVATINHALRAKLKPLLSFAPRHGGSLDLKHRSQDICCLWTCFSLPINCRRMDRSLPKRFAFLYSGYWFFPSCGTSVPSRGGHCITVSLVQQEDCGKGYTTVISLYGLYYNNLRQILLVTSLVKGP